MKLKSPVLGEVTIRSDVYRIMRTSVSGTNFAFTYCSDCLGHESLNHNWRTYRQLYWPKDNLTCQKCGAMTQPTFDRLSLEAYRKLHKRKVSNGKKAAGNLRSRK